MQPTVEQIFERNRIRGGALSYLLILLYSPVGILLALIRTFIYLQIFLAKAVLSEGSVTRRYALQCIYCVVGLVVSQKGKGYVSPQTRLLVANYRSIYDQTAVDLLVNNIGGTPELGLLSRLYEFLFDPGSPTNPQRTYASRLKSLIENEKRVPVLTQPEGTAANGEKGLLKFGLGSFSTGYPCQPVSIEIWRPLPIASATLDSSIFWDNFWFLFSPCTYYSISFLPPVERTDSESVEEFSERTRQSLATALGVPCTNFTRRDKADLRKRLAVTRRAANVPPGARYSRVAFSGRSDLRDAVQEKAGNIKAILPQVPLQDIVEDLLRTHDESLTLTNFLEGNIQYTPETVPIDGKSSTTGATVSSNYEQTSLMPPSRATRLSETTLESCHLTFSERKAALLAEARHRYIIKHNLNKK